VVSVMQVWVRAYEDRIDLLSVMIAGPSKTPYEGGLFVFDVQLGGEYPRAPPLCHYHSYCTDRLNPNLYEDGKVGTRQWCALVIRHDRQNRPKQLG
jgi:ubiquitin-conjugating enzyme E2 O